VTVGRHPVLRSPGWRLPIRVTEQTILRRQWNRATMSIRNPASAQFCWVDLAATDAAAARSFYGALFRWRAQEHNAGDGQFTRLMIGQTAVASLYQLSRRHLAHGVPSHWTPYVAVDNSEEAASEAVSLGAKVIVKPFEVTGIARVCLIQDPVGALIGLWQHPE
jgi:predicted enzyme related to lactoylglutathione lyase